jgi:hypothetical protein
LLVSFCARSARLAMIDSVSRRQSKMWDFGAELVHPPTLCPNSDAVMIVAFAHRLGQRDTVSGALKVAREIKRSAMSGAQSAPALENRQRIHGTHKNGTNLGVPWRRHKSWQRRTDESSPSTSVRSAKRHHKR